MSRALLGGAGFPALPLLTWVSGLKLTRFFRGGSLSTSFDLCGGFVFVFLSVVDLDHPHEKENGRLGNLSHPLASAGVRKKRMARRSTNIITFSWISIFSLKRSKKNVTVLPRAPV